MFVAPGNTEGPRHPEGKEATRQLVLNYALGLAERESEKSGKEVAGSGSAGRRESLTRSLDHREKEDGGRRERGRHSQTAAGGLNIKKGRDSVP